MLAKKLTRHNSPNLMVAQDGRWPMERGGLEDIVSTVGLLQLINGGENEPLRTCSTKKAIVELQRADLLTPQEAALLNDSFDLLTRFGHRAEAEGIPLSPESLRRIAWYLNYRDGQSQGDSASLCQSLQVSSTMTCKVIQSLLQDAAKGSAIVPAETELVLDPEPDDRLIVETMTEHRLGDPRAAMLDLQRLADEPYGFCRVVNVDITSPTLLQRYLMPLDGRPILGRHYQRSSM